MIVELFTGNGYTDTVALLGASSEGRICGRGRLQAAPNSNLYTPIKGAVLLALRLGHRHGGFAETCRAKLSRNPFR
jgi:hypothetical protein